MLVSRLRTSNSGVGQKTLHHPRYPGLKGETWQRVVSLECWVLGAPESILCWLPEPRAMAQLLWLLCPIHSITLAVK